MCDRLKKITLTSAALMLVAGSLQNCAPMKARQVRAMKPVMVGLPIGAMFRPTGDFALGVNYGSFKNNGIEMNKTEAKEKNDPTLKRSALQSSTVLRLHTHYYPWADSAFFVGLGLDYYNSRVVLDPIDSGEGGLALAENNPTEDYSVKTTQVRLPVGWSWIWTNGISLLLDMGPVVSTSQSSESNQDGIEAESSTAGSEKLVLDYEKGGFISPVFMLGYSF